MRPEMPQRAASARQRMAACALVEMAASVKEKPGTQDDDRDVRLFR
jgi:hypothetical protein